MKSNLRVRRLPRLGKQEGLSRSVGQLNLEITSPGSTNSDLRPIRQLRSDGAIDCAIVSVGKRRDGGTRFWCLSHKADATAKYGRKASECRYASQPAVRDDEILKLDAAEYPGGVALWGAVPPVFDTTRLRLDRGIHVHARKLVDKRKDIDWTYRQVDLCGGATPEALRINELDAIYAMVSSVFGLAMKPISCTYCGYSHLDKDWFAVHPHRRHLCSGCGKHFRDDTIAVGNPVEHARASFGHATRTKPARKSLTLCQTEWPGGIQIWGSNPAVIWTSNKPEEEGIHVHAFRADGTEPDLDDTYSEVEVDGVALDTLQVRTLMAQRSLPHLNGRVCSQRCPECNSTHFAIGAAAFTPSLTHTCAKCRRDFKSVGRTRKVVLNPLVETLGLLAQRAVRSPQQHDLGLLPETI